MLSNHCNHFDNVDEPEYAAIKFVANEATIYVIDEFDTIKLLQMENCNLYRAHFLSETAELKTEIRLSISPL